MFNNCVLYISNDEFLCETLTNFAQKRSECAENTSTPYNFQLLIFNL